MYCCINKENSYKRTNLCLNPPIFLTTEVGVNHNGDLNFIKGLIDTAEQAQFNAAKF